MKSTAERNCFRAAVVRYYAGTERKGERILKPAILIPIILYLALMNLTGFFLMGADKRRARLHKWRIPEKTFFIVSILGGGLGTWIGMYGFRHKTRHWYFVLFLPLIVLAHAALLALLILRN